MGPLVADHRFVNCGDVDCIVGGCAAPFSKTPRQRNYLVVGFLGSAPIDPSREAVPLATPPSDAIGG